jgi:hypothetical protein
MSRSIHTSRAKFRKASSFDYSTEKERVRVLGKIVDEALLKRDLKENARRKKQAAKAGLERTLPVDSVMSAAWKKAPPSNLAKAIVASSKGEKHVRKH